jgi:DNA-binding response OmpR family regulator
MYAEYLRGEGFEVREVGTTDEALTLTSGVDLVITGLMVRAMSTHSISSAAHDLRVANRSSS